MEMFITVTSAEKVEGMTDVSLINYKWAAR